jgi:hypothetical protein
VADLNGKDFIALVRLSDGADHTLADAGQTCERVPAGKHGGTASDALQKLLDAKLIAPAPTPAAAPMLAAPAPVDDAPADVDEGAE